MRATYWRLIRAYISVSFLVSAWNFCKDGSSGNCLVTLGKVIYKTLHSPCYIFLNNLAVTDMCLLPIAVPISIHTLLVSNMNIYYIKYENQFYLILVGKCRLVLFT
jgi:hypothetical protein